MVRNPGVIEVWRMCLEIMETVLKNDTVVLNLPA
jgi:glutathionylspermidine synthase